MKRAIIVGLIGVAILSSISYFNDFVLKQTQLIGNHLPISVFGGMILFLITINALLYKISKRFAFTGRELAIVMALVLVACSIPAGGLMRVFTSTLVYPHHYARTEPGWKEQKIIEHTPAKLLVDISKDETKVLNGFVQGMAIGAKSISFKDIPWHAWKRTFMFWLPFLFVIWIGIVGLSLVVHRQWAHHEQLPYPVAMFANAILPSEGRPFGWLLENRLFWTSTLVVLGIHLINYSYKYFPNSIQIPLAFDFSKLEGLSETLRLGGLGYYFNITLFLSVIGIAYFIPTEVSFSLAMGPMLWIVVMGICRTRGFEPWRGAYGAGGVGIPTPTNLFPFGAALALIGALIYNGRAYYGQVFKKALFIKTKEDSPRESVWGARIFMVCFVVTVVNLMSVGQDLYIATMLAGGMFIVYIIQARVVAETGYYMFVPALGSFIVAFFGINVVGPVVFIPMFFIVAILFYGGTTREALMPYVVHAMKILDQKKIKVGRTTGWFAVALALSLAIAVPVSLYFQYDRGKAGLWPTGIGLGRAAFQGSVILKQRLESQGSVESANQVSGIERFLKMKPDMRSMGAMGLGMLCAGIFAFARIRIPGWPLHPALFLFWHDWCTKMVWASFFIGFLIKKAVTKYGGEKIYQSFKPVMFGLIAGDMLGGIIPAAIGLAYHLITGELPQKFSTTLW